MISAMRSSCGLLPCGPVRQKAMRLPSCDAAGCSPPSARMTSVSGRSRRTKMRPGACSRTPYRLGSPVGDGAAVAMLVGARLAVLDGEGSTAGPVDEGTLTGGAHEIRSVATMKSVRASATARSLASAPNARRALRRAQSQQFLHLTQRPLEPLGIRRCGRQEIDPFQHRDDERRHVLGIDGLRDASALDRATEQRAQRRDPNLVHLPQNLGHAAIARGALRELAHDLEELGLLAREAPQTLEVLAQLLVGLSFRGERRLEPRERETNDAANEVLLRREVVVERGDVHADGRGHLARAKSLEAVRRDLAV